MEIKEAIEGRRSVREYEPEAIDESVIHRLIAAAVKAPSAVNQQPWTFTVVRDQELLERISRKAKAHVLATSTHDAHADDFRKLLSDPDFHIFYRAPVLIVISAAAHGPWIVEDCTLAADNLMLSAFTEHLVDWLRSELPQHAQGKIRPWNSGAMGSGRAYHCRETQDLAAIGSS